MTPPSFRGTCSSAARRISELAKHTQGFIALAEMVQAGPMENAALTAEIEALHETWYAARPIWDQLFVYRDYGKF